MGRIGQRTRLTKKGKLMTGEVAQLCAIVTHTNHSIRHGEPVDIMATETFRYVESVVLMVQKKQSFKQTWEPLGSSLGEWMSSRGAEGCARLNLLYQHSQDQSFIKDYQSSGFVGGGGSWLIEERRESTSNLWASKWEVGNREDPEQKIWKVSYGRIADSAAPIDYSFLDGLQTREKLETALREILDFSRRHRDGDFSDCFQSALDILDGRQPSPSPYSVEVCPRGYLDGKHEALLKAADAGWVFGAMGSWNDWGSSDHGIEKEYQELSSRLYSLVCDAIVTAVNEL